MRVRSQPSSERTCSRISISTSPGSPVVSRISAAVRRIWSSPSESIFMNFGRSSFGRAPVSSDISPNTVDGPSFATSRSTPSSETITDALPSSMR